MGQVTLPVLNRKGVFDFWENNWENKNFYSMNISEDIFLKKFLKLFLQTWLTNKKHTLKLLIPNDINKKKLNYKKYYYIFEDFNWRNNLEKNSVFRQFPYYTSKIFLIKYSNWIVIYAYIYIPRTWYKKFDNIASKSSNYINILYLYKFHRLKNKFLNN